jgi:hypothetical protein
MKHTEWFLNISRHDKGTSYHIADKQLKPFDTLSSANAIPIAICYDEATAQIITVSPELLEMAKLIRKACGVQANLNSTATQEERSRFISSVFDAMNNVGTPALMKAGLL